jgi:DNA-directed RNA polymerase specialized sigma24 family protein
MEKQRRDGINRKMENELVLEFQKTRDEGTFLKIYNPRIDTFKYLSNKYSYVCDDMYSEVQLVFMKAINGYRKGGRSFNTYYYTSVLNHIKNINKSKKRNKRTLSNGDDPSEHFLYLDDSVDRESLSGSTFHDIVASGDGDMIRSEVKDLLTIISEKSEILFNVAVDMMATGKQPVRRQVYEFTGTLMDGEDPETCIDRITGIGRKCYRVIELDIMEREIRFVIDVSCQRAFAEIVEEIRLKERIGM